MRFVLKMNGTTDKLEIPQFQFDKVILDIMVTKKSDWGKYWSSNYGWFQKNSNGINDQWDTGIIEMVYKNNIPQINLTPFVNIGERAVFTIKLNKIINSKSFIFANMGAVHTGGEIYNIKYYLGGTLQAHYDINTGTVKDQSGNGFNGILTGGTWIDNYIKVARLRNDGKLLIKGEIVENNATNRPPHLTSEGDFMVGELVELATATPVGSAYLIAGNTSAGFYGEVAASEFINGDELASRLGLTYGISHNSNSSWLKFEYQNKIEYISKNTLRYNISWNEINEVGLVDGNRTIDIDGFRYKVRLIESDDEINGEYSKLFYPIHIKAKNQSWNFAQFVNIPTEYWGIDYSDADLNMGTGNGRGTWTSSLFTGTKTLRGMGSLEASGRWYGHQTSDNFGWRPVLELVGTVSEGTKVSINTLARDILVHKYIHQGNKVIQPTGLNKETGLFTTTEPIALAPGTKRQVITAFNYQSDGSIPREWRGGEAHYIDVVSSTSFYIRSGSANGKILTYTNTNNNLVDVNSFRFEYDYRNTYQIDLSEYNIKKGKFNFKGTRHRPGWTYIYLDVNHSGGKHQHNYGTFADGRDYLSLDITGLFSIDDDFVSARIENYIKSEWNDSNGMWVYSQGSGGNVLNQSFDNPSFDNINFSFAMANGSVVEIYDIVMDNELKVSELLEGGV